MACQIRWSWAGTTIPPLAQFSLSAREMPLVDGSVLPALSLAKGSIRDSGQQLAAAENARARHNPRDRCSARPLFSRLRLPLRLQGLSRLPRLFVAATLPGWVGVNLFFVLSGFLITGILLDTKLRPNYYRSFYVRRALRILPLYYAVLLLLAVLTRTGWVHRSALWGFLGLSFLYLSNVTELFGVPMQYGVLWSLAVEEHFYLLWPAAVRSLSRRRVAMVGVGICVLCASLRAFYYIRGYNTGTGYTWLVADGLATGAVSAAMARGPWGTRTRMRTVTAISLCCECDDIRRRLPIWNIPGQSILRGFSPGNSIESLLCGRCRAGAVGWNISVEATREPSSAAVFR